MRPSRTGIISCTVAGALFGVASASRTVQYEDYSGAQYLAYNGTVSATVSYDPALGEGCIPETFGPYVNSYVYVGVNAPWDTNPFFFELYHLATEDIGYLGFTDDLVYNLAFSSSVFACWTKIGNHPCSFWEWSTDVRWKPEIVLNLNKTTTKKTELDGEEGYVVTGNETSFNKNTTERATINGVDVASGCYVDLDTGITWRGWIWYVFTPGSYNSYETQLWREDLIRKTFADTMNRNDTAAYTYSISFTNSSATASIKTQVGQNTMELTYKGDRITNSSWPNLKLVTTDDSKPQFRYNNDSEIHFQKDYIYGWWDASANEFPSSTSTGLPTSTSSRGGSFTGSTITPSSTGVADIVHTPGAFLSFFLALGGFFVF